MHPGGRAFLLCGLALCCAGGRPAFYDPDFDAENPPVYLRAAAVSEAPVAKIRLEDIVPGSPAEQAGLSRGDEVLTVNGAKPATASAFYRSLFQAEEGGAAKPVKLLVLRGAVRRLHRIQPRADASGTVLGIRCRFFDAGEHEIDGGMRIIEREPTPEGSLRDTLYEFRKGVKLSARCHWWGGHVLVAEFHVVNLSASPIAVNPETLRAEGRFGRALEPLDPEVILHGIYDVEGAKRALGRPWFPRRKKQAVAALESMNELREELEGHRLESATLDPGRAVYGAVYYELDRWQAPVTFRFPVAGETFNATFLFEAARPPAPPAAPPAVPAAPEFPESGEAEETPPPLFKHGIPLKSWLAHVKQGLLYWKPHFERSEDLGFEN